MDDIELRISILFNSINSHFENYKKPEPITEERILENGKRGFAVAFGGEEISKEEKLEAINRFNLIIHNLSNLKDNLKNYLKNNGMDDALVEKNISDSIYLSIITDLANQEKHGYPLQRSKRSRLDPKIINFRNSIAIKMPVGNIYFNPMDGKIQISADVVDSNNNFLFYFNELVEKSVESWESFFTQNIPKVSSEIIERKNAEEIKKHKISRIQHIVDEANKIFENSEWINFPAEELQLGMIVRISENDQFSDLIRGIVTNIFTDENSIQNAIVYLDSQYEESMYSVKQFNWQYIKVSNPNDLAVLSHYYYSYPKMISDIFELR